MPSAVEKLSKSGPGRKRLELPSVKIQNAFAIWMAERKLSVEQLAAILNVDRATIYGWRRGSRPPSLRMAIRISQLTDGEVSAESWSL